jgi:hypothetical protein
MRLDALLRAHGFMRVERPPRLWEADTDDERFIPLLGEVAWEADATWAPGRPWALPWLDDLTRRLAPAGVRFGYTRNLQPGGSITVFLPRLVELPNAGPGADSGSGAAAPRRARRA